MSERQMTWDEVVDELVSVRAKYINERRKCDRLREALRPLLRIAVVYEDSGLDEHRPEWGYRDPNTIPLVQARGGSDLLTLADAFIARAALQEAER